MTLKHLLDNIPYQLIQGDLNTEINGISHDTREIKEGDLFLCIKGIRFDSHEYLNEIIDKGVSAIIVERPLEDYTPLNNHNIPIIKVNNVRDIEGDLASSFYDFPSKKLKTIGITGSKGKTTVTHMIAQILKENGKKVGIIGTNGYILDGKTTELNNTTPSALEIQTFLKDMVDHDADFAIIECSSQGLKMGRLNGIDFDAGVFLNIAQGDHIGTNEHTDFNDYLMSKKILIENSKLGFVNKDDFYSKEITDDITNPIIYFGTNEDSDYYLNDYSKIYIENSPLQIFSIDGKLKDEFQLNLPGNFNITNAIAAIAVTNELGFDTDTIKRSLSNLNITGRFDIVHKDDFTVCVDFAHNGYSIRNHLEALSEYRPKRIICVFGADGNRSKYRRYEMGEASGRLADVSIVTAGHNRWETFDKISNDIKFGLDKTDGEYIIIPDRKDAIRYALENAQKGDFITILGLGHETYQEENGIKYPHNDKNFVLKTLKELNLI